MTNHIKSSIENIIFKGGFVSKNLETYIIKLSEIRHPSSIEREFKEAFADIENRKGSIIPSTKTKVFEVINSIWDNYPKGERELYTKGFTTQIENGIITNKHYVSQ